MSQNAEDSLKREIIYILNEYGAAILLPYMRHKHKVIDSVAYRWKVSSGGMHLDRTYGTKGQNSYNIQLKRPFADTMQHDPAMEDLLGKDGDASSEALSGRTLFGEFCANDVKGAPRYRLLPDAYAKDCGPS